jgi:PiT family inorganic phosphate transporter
MGSRVLTYPEALGLASIGVLAGIALEGYKLSGAITSGIASSSNPGFTMDVVLSTILIMAFLTYRKIPISLSQVAVGAAIGAAVARGIEVNWHFTILVASSWLLTPVAGLTLAFVLSHFTSKMAKRIRKVLTLNSLYAYLTVFSGAYSAYVLGANTVGLIVDITDFPRSEHLLVLVGFGLATIIGMILLSEGTTRSVAENIIGLNPSAAFAAQMGGAITVHGFTEFGIPVSVSQAVVGGIFGAAIPRKIVVRNDRLTRELVIGWTIAPLVGAALSMLLAAFV